MFSIRLLSVLAVTGALAVTAACVQKTAGIAPAANGDDDDSSKSGDDDDSTAKDGGSSGTTTSSSSSSSGSSGTPVDSGPPPKSKMTFFVSSTAAGTGGNLGGLTGADKKCQDLATAVQGGDHTWAAYLSTKAGNAKDRIGPGPWVNQKGTTLATSVDDLHLLEDNEGKLRIQSDKLLDEKGAAVPPEGRFILTGTNALGTLSNANQTCNDWTSANNQQVAQFGDSSPELNPNAGAGWMFAKGIPTAGCQNLQNNLGSKSQGRVFCFAKD
jgi:hypothetical protein